MRRLPLVLIALALLMAPASAEQMRPSKFDSSTSGKALPLRQPKSDNSCAAYGAGFVKLAGTDTCVQVGGSISVGVGGSVRR